MPTFDITEFLNAKNKAKKGTKLQWSSIRFAGTGPAEKEWPVSSWTGKDSKDSKKVAVLTGTDILDSLRLQRLLQESTTKQFAETRITVPANPKTLSKDDVRL